jgi:hypothetical protein
MTCHLVELCLDANDPRRLAAFWAGVLSGRLVDDPQDGIPPLLPNDDTGSGSDSCQRGGRRSARIRCTAT